MKRKVPSGLERVRSVTRAGDVPAPAAEAETSKDVAAKDATADWRIVMAGGAVSASGVCRSVIRKRAGMLPNSRKKITDAGELPKPMLIVHGKL
jgi:hypothetical protein